MKTAVGGGAEAKVGVAVGIGAEESQAVGRRKVQWRCKEGAKAKKEIHPTIS
jgi:hypothetical protein